MKKIIKIMIVGVMVFMIFSLSGFEVKAESCGQVTRKIFTLLIVIYNFIQAVICQLMILSITAIPKEQSVSTTMLGKIAIIILMMEIQNVIWLITQSSLIARIQRVGVVVEGVLIGSAVRLDR